MSVMSHTTIVLLDMGVMPVSPLLWHRRDSDGILHVWDMKCPIEAKINLPIIEDFLADRMWARVSSHEANGGLGDGESDLTVAKKVIAQPTSAGKKEQAKALECVVCHGFWAVSEPIPTILSSHCVSGWSPVRLAAPCMVDLPRQRQPHR